MKDIAIEELAALSPEIHEAAARLGCTHVAVTGRIWPGGRLSGPEEEAARFVEYSWLKAAVVGGQAIFEETDAKPYAALLEKYGLGGEAYVAPEMDPEPSAPTPAAAAPTPRANLSVAIRPETLRELERQAAAEGLSVGGLLDWKFQPRPSR